MRCNSKSGLNPTCQHSLGLLENRKRVLGRDNIFSMTVCPMELFKKLGMIDKIVFVPNTYLNIAVSENSWAI